MSVDYLAMSVQVSRLSSCNKRKVGAVVVRNGVVISVGVNHGNGEPCTCRFGTKNPLVMHAEQHALSQHIDYKNATIYVSYKPCSNCETMISDNGISNIEYIK
ncbi:MAG: hypothetical protein [Caudoviricetes sp.]|nr:MAG: hypothetical protein [Caudoviricetes sp.]